MRIVLLGKPGSGKGTQAGMVREKFGYYHLSSGDVLRENISRGTDLGKKIEEHVRKGEIGPEKVITEAILQFIEKRGIEDELILDGFPRTLYQAERLDEVYPPDLCLLLEISDRESVRRLSGRYICTDCGAPHRLKGGNQTAGQCRECGGKLVQRKDDKPEAIETRLEVFREEVEPVISHYRKKNLLETLDGSLPPDEVYNNIRYSIMQIVGPN